MSELTELERRIAAALDRIARAAEASPPVPEGPSPAEVALAEALEAERATATRVSERLRREAAAQAARLAEAAARLGRAQDQLERQAFEMEGLRRANAALAEANAALVSAQAAETPDVAAATAALAAELEALRAARRSEVAELEALMAELAPLAEADAAPPEDTAEGMAAGQRMADRADGSDPRPGSEDSAAEREARNG